MLGGFLELLRKGRLRGFEMKIWPCQMSADIRFSFNSDEHGIAENSLRLPFANPAMQT